MTKVTDLAALAGAAVDTAADLIPVLDVSEAGNARNKKMTFAEFLLAQREGIQDLINTFLVAGTNVTLTYDDAGNILTIDVGVPAPGDITGLNEAIDDRVAALITAGSGISKSYNDGAGTLTLTATAPSGGMVFKGALDCSANPNYPAALQGESYVASVAGKIGGASGESVDVGDLIIASADNAGGTEASVGSSWIVLEKNLVGAATAGAITGSGLTMATSRILGRVTPSTGAVEELTAAQVKTLLGIAAALASDLNTGTDADKFATADAIAGSKFGTATITLLISDPGGSAITTGDGKAYWRVPSTLAGMDLVAVAAALTTVSSSGLPTVQIANVTDGVDMLSTKLSINASATDSSTATTPAVIDATKDDVATGDMLRIDIDVAGTGAKGLMVEMQFRLP